MTDARGFSNITNPYGLLRSPWNTNDVPYLLRSRYVLGVKDAGYSLPTCGDFASYLGPSTYVKIADITAGLNGVLHGPVHILTGGHWGMDPKIEKKLGDYKYAHNTSAADNFLLGAKFLWRQGLVRCPTHCDSSMDAGDKCTCVSSRAASRAFFLARARDADAGALLLLPTSARVITARSPPSAFPPPRRRSLSPPSLLLARARARSRACSLARRARSCGCRRALGRQEQADPARVGDRAHLHARLGGQRVERRRDRRGPRSRRARARAREPLPLSLSRGGGA